MDQINVPSHELSERGFGLAFRVFPQELLVGQTVHSLNSTRRRPNRTGQGAIQFEGTQFRRDTATKTPLLLGFSSPVFLQQLFAVCNRLSA